MGKKSAKAKNAINEETAQKAVSSSCAKCDDEVFRLLCNHVSDSCHDLREMMDKNKQNLLTIMSFCFLGIISYVSVRAEYIQSSLPVWILLIVGLFLWLFAFAFAIVVNPGKRYQVIPGENENISFLPNYPEKGEFRENRVSAFRPDWFFMMGALERLGDDKRCNLAPLSERELNLRFREAVSSNEDLSFFNKNAWLASLVHVYLGQSKHWKDIKRVYLAIRIVFVVSIACVATAIFLDFLL